MGEPGEEWLSGPELAALCALGARRRFPLGATVFLEGDEPYDVVIIDAGDIKVSTTALTGQELVLDVLGPGELLGELSAIDGARRSASAVALTDLEVTAVPAERFVGFLAEHPLAMRELLAVMVRRLRTSNRRQLEYSAADALGRVCHRLDELADRYGDDNPASVRLELPLTQTELAQWCGLSREAVVKALRKLRNLGWVTMSDGCIVIEDRQQLHERGSL